MAYINQLVGKFGLAPTPEGSHCIRGPWGSTCANTTVNTQSIVRVGDLPANVERPSACADASRRHLEARSSHRSPAERAEDLRVFNERLAEIVKAGRSAK